MIKPWRLIGLSAAFVLHAAAAHAQTSSPDALAQYLSESPKASVWLVDVVGAVEGPASADAPAPVPLARVKVVEALWGEAPAEALVYRSVAVDPDCPSDSCRHEVTPYPEGRQIIVTTDCMPGQYRCAVAPGIWEFSADEKEALLNRIRPEGRS